MLVSKNCTCPVRLLSTRLFVRGSSVSPAGNKSFLDVATPQVKFWMTAVSLLWGFTTTIPIKMSAEKNRCYNKFSFFDFRTGNWWNKFCLPLSRVDTAMKRFSGAIVKCLIGAGNLGRKDLSWGFPRVHFTRTHSLPPVYKWPPD